MQNNELLRDMVKRATTTLALLVDGRCVRNKLYQMIQQCLWESVIVKEASRKNIATASRNSEEEPAYKTHREPI